ncbi:MAG: phospholipid carrier-dependent glycosyltransferase [Candidatus Dadabacteria bacterium]|nr:MAG: phospholipid carrier-dependent glycosyltransferase [Candidatus Dadabacteria bacterium]
MNTLKLKDSRFWIVAAAGLLALYLLSISFRPLFTPDEVRYAELPREMLTSGDWIIPRLDNLTYFEKPPLQYWLTAGVMLVAGEIPFAVRFIPALSALLTALVLFLLIKKSVESVVAAGLAASSYLLSTLVYAVSTTATLDSLLTFFLTAIMASFYFAMEAGDRKKELLWLIVCGLSSALAFLTKGFLAFALPVTALIPFLLWKKRWRTLLVSPWIVFIVALLAVLPWALLIHARDSSFWPYFFWEEHIRRFLASNAQHAEPFWFHIPTILWGALPWTFLFPAAFLGLRQLKNRPLIVDYSITWFIFPFLFFSVCRGKLITYVLPCVPPLIILFTIGILQYFKSPSRKAFNCGALLLAFIMGAAFIVLLLNYLSGFPSGKVLYTESESLKFIIVSVSLLLFSVFSWFSARRNTPEKKLMFYALAPVALYAAIGFAIPQYFIDKRAPGEFYLKNAGHISPGTLIVAASPSLVQSACWYYKRTDVYILFGAGELSYGLKYPGQAARHLKTAEDLAALLESGKVKSNLVLIIKRKDWQRVKSELPRPAFIDMTHKLVFAEYKANFS